MIATVVPDAEVHLIEDMTALGCIWNPMEPYGVMSKPWPPDAYWSNDTEPPPAWEHR